MIINDRHYRIRSQAITRTDLPYLKVSRLVLLTSTKELLQLIAYHLSLTAYRLSLITMTRIYIKNMAGDLFPLEVTPSNNLQVILQALYALDPIAYPSFRTTVFRIPQDDEEDSKEVEPVIQEDEAFYVFVSDGPVIEKGTFPIGGQPYVRFVIPIAGKTIYIYRNHMFETIVYGMSLSPLVTRPSDSHRYARTLYDAVRAVHSDVTPAEMLEVYDTVFPYLEQEQLDNNLQYKHEFNPKEPIECECGSVIQRSSLTGHDASKKHKLFLKSQKALEA